MGGAFAAGANSSTFFAQGQKAYNAGQRKEALRLFRKAEAQGMKKASLYYNIGVCSYSLKQYPEAKAAFQEVIVLSKDMAPLAHYNLGLIGMREGNRQEMIAGFETAIATSSDPKIRDMAAAALDENNVRQRAGATPYAGYFEISVGYDDNIELYSDLLGSKGDGDWFTEVFAAGTMPINGGTFRRGTQLFGSMYYQKFADYDEYDLGTVAVGVQYLFDYNGWKIKPGVDYSYTIQDTKSYDQTPSFSIKGRHGFYWDTQIRLSYKISYIDILDSTYDATQGTRNKFRTEIIKKWQKTSVSLRYTLELNSRDSDDLSPTRNTVAVKVRHRFTDQFSGVASVAFRNSSYDNTVAYDRDEDRWKTTLRGIYKIDPIWTVVADYTYSDNEDNQAYARYNYTRSVSALRLERSF